MNNLEMIQEASVGAYLGARCKETMLECIGAVQLDNGFRKVAVIPPQLSVPIWVVWIDDDSLEYEFADCASAYDFAAEELRMAN